MTTTMAKLWRTTVAHVQTWRPYTLWYVGLLGLAGAGLSPGPRLLPLILGWITPTIGWIGGHYLSDYFDRDLDAASKPHRPIPSGRLGALTALVCGLGAMLAVVGLAVLSGPHTAVIAALAVVGIAAYGLVLKAHGLAGNLVRGMLGALSLLYGAAVTESYSWQVVLFAVAFWLHDAASNLVGTLRDVDGDRAGGYRTVPVQHGTAAGVRVAWGLYLSALGTAVLAGGATLGFDVALAGVAIVGASAFQRLLRRQADPSPAVALRAHEILVVERLGLAASVVGLGLGAGAAATLLAPMIVVTWWTQRRMRTWYELGSTTLQVGGTADADADV